MQMASHGQLVAAPIPARRYDTGNKLDYLKANVEFGLKREDLGPEFLAYLKELVSGR
jgi:UTP--glucose-1-phosphate uridylyltransferase